MHTLESAVLGYINNDLTLHTLTTIFCYTNAACPKTRKESDLEYTEVPLPKNSYEFSHIQDSFQKDLPKAKVLEVIVTI